MWKKYDDEFRRNALNKVSDGQSVRSAAEESGGNESLIHKWKRTALTKGNGNRSRAEICEIEVLKKRNRELEQENEILSGSLRESSAEEGNTLRIYRERKDQLSDQCFVPRDAGSAASLLSLCRSGNLSAKHLRCGGQGMFLQQSPPLWFKTNCSKFEDRTRYGAKADAA